MRTTRYWLTAACALLLALVSVPTTSTQAQETTEEPQETLIITAAWQPFENGVLFWNSFGSPNDEIWVLVDDGGNLDDGRGTLYVRIDQWPGEAVSTTNCAIDPVRGFGYLYNRLEAGIREDLGCPLGDEIGYDGSVVIDSVNLTFSIDGPGATVYSGTLSNNSVPTTGTWQTDVFF